MPHPTDCYCMACALGDADARYERAEEAARDRLDALGVPARVQEDLCATEDLLDAPEAVEALLIASRTHDLATLRRKVEAWHWALVHEGPTAVTHLPDEDLEWEDWLLRHLRSELCRDVVRGCPCGSRWT